MSGCGRCVATVTSRAVVPGINNDQMTASQAWATQAGKIGRVGSAHHPTRQCNVPASNDAFGAQKRDSGRSEAVGLLRGRSLPLVKVGLPGEPDSLPRPRCP